MTTSRLKLQASRANFGLNVTVLCLEHLLAIEFLNSLRCQWLDTKEDAEQILLWCRSLDKVRGPDYLSYPIGLFTNLFTVTGILHPLTPLHLQTQFLEKNKSSFGCSERYPV